MQYNVWVIIRRSLKWDNFVITNINSWYNNLCKQYVHALLYYAHVHIVFCGFQGNKMINIVLWRSTIGCFFSKFKCFVGYSAFEKGMLHTALNKWLNFAVLHVKCM